jgi:hypothetical protein
MLGRGSSGSFTGVCRIVYAENPRVQTALMFVALVLPHLLDAVMYAAAPAALQVV